MGKLNTILLVGIVAAEIGACAATNSDAPSRSIAGSAGQSAAGTTASGAGGSAAPAAGSGGSAGGASGKSGVTAGTGGGSKGGRAGTGTGGGAGKAVDAGAGGEGGELVPPEPRPLACDHLPAVGKWEEVTPPGQGPGVASVSVDPLQPGVVFAGLLGSSNVWGGPGQGLWKTSDCGATWTHVNTGENADAIETGSLVYILISPFDSNLMYTNSLYGGLGIYKSTDGGVNWSDIRPKGDGIPDFVQGEAMDPKDPNHLLMTFHGDCSGAHAPMCAGETFDGGKTWRIFDGPKDATGWVEQAGWFFLDKKTWLFGGPSYGLYYTDDAGATYQKKLDYPGCHGFGKLIDTGNGWVLPCWGGIATSPNAIDWEIVQGSPHTLALERAGDTLFASFVIDDSGNPFWSASVTDPTHWTTVKTDHTFGAGAFEFSYDSNHHILYTADFSGGLWRVVTE